MLNDFVPDNKVQYTTIWEVLVTMPTITFTDHISDLGKCARVRVFQIFFNIMIANALNILNFYLLSRER